MACESAGGTTHEYGEEERQSRVKPGSGLSRGPDGTREIVALFIAIGGGIGSTLRFGISQWFGPEASAGFPWATLTANVAGSAVLGLLLGAFTRFTPSGETRAALTVGFCGGLTTFSTFSRETYSLLQAGRPVGAFIYVVASAGICLLAVALGIRLLGS